jgi:hypothetical protein
VPGRSNNPDSGSLKGAETRLMNKNSSRWADYYALKPEEQKSVQPDDLKNSRS